MSKQTSSQQTSSQQTTSRHGALRRAMASLAAAGAIAFGGVGTLSATEALAAGVRQQTYVVQPSTVQVQTSTLTGSPRGKD